MKWIIHEASHFSSNHADLDTGIVLDAATVGYTRNVLGNVMKQTRVSDVFKL